MNSTVNENYIKSLVKSHKEIRESYKSRYSQAIERINSLETEMIYSTSLPGMDYSNPSVKSSTISDSTFRAVNKLEKMRKTEEIYKELERLREKLDEIDLISDLYRSLQSFIPVHYEITNQLYYLDCGYEYCVSHFGRATATITDMANTTVSLVCRFYNEGLTSNEVNNMSLDDFIQYIGKEEYTKLYNRETKIKR